MGQKEVLDILEAGAKQNKRFRYYEIAAITNTSEGSISRCVCRLKKWYKINTESVTKGPIHYYNVWINKKDLKRLAKNSWDN